MPKGYTHVTHEERCQIYALKSTGMSIRKIAYQLKKDASTISREIIRNSGKRGYRYKQAHEKAVSRRKKASSSARKMTASAINIINQCLLLEWSPEQISGRMKAEGRSISHESIYQHIWQDKKNGGFLYKHLRRYGRRRNKRSSGMSGRGHIPNRIDISTRPRIVDSKSRIGDWEGDTIIGAKHQGAILSYVDRHSKFTILRKLERKTALLVKNATLQSMVKIKDFVHTITYDNGKEFCAHQEIAEQLNAKCFFATPYRSCERGLNEHTNGLVRQYLPKNTDFSKISDAMIAFVENRLNHRPRRSLNYKTPFEVFHSQCLSFTGVALRC